jgi:hypothetical protein
VIGLVFVPDAQRKGNFHSKLENELKLIFQISAGQRVHIQFRNLNQKVIKLLVWRALCYSRTLRIIRSEYASTAGYVKCKEHTILQVESSFLRTI